MTASITQKGNAGWVAGWVVWGRERRKRTRSEIDWNDRGEDRGSAGDPRGAERLIRFSATSEKHIRAVCVRGRRASSRVWGVALFTSGACCVRVALLT